MSEKSDTRPPTHSGEVPRQNHRISDFIDGPRWSPQSAVERYLAEQHDLNDQTEQKYRRILSWFTDYWRDQGVSDLSQLEEADITNVIVEYARQNPSEEETYSSTTIEKRTELVERVLKYWESEGPVTPGLHEELELPSHNEVIGGE